jgi:hypothetical protein
MFTKYLLTTIAGVLLLGNIILAQQLKPGEPDKPLSDNTPAVKPEEDKLLIKLIAMLKSKNETVQLRAAERLIDYGIEAVEALEPLAELTESTNEKLRQTASIAFNQIANKGKYPAKVTTEKPKDEKKDERESSEKLAIANSSEVDGQQTYNVKLDASKMPLVSGQYVVRVENAEKIVEEKKVDIATKDGKPVADQTIPVKLSPGKNTITITPRVGKEDLKKLTAEKEILCNNCDDDIAGERINFRAVVGFEQVGASSAASKQNPFVDLYLSTPFGLTSRYNHKLSLTPSVWSSLRFTTTPVQGIAALANFTPVNFANNFVQGDSASKVNDLVQTFDFLVGFEQPIVPRRKFVGFIPGETSISFIVAGGAINPLSSEKTTAFYKVPRVNNGADIDPRFLAAFPEAAGKTNIAFVSPERDRFFRQYYAGLRFKTMFRNSEIRYQPAMFDVTFGQNEAITNRLQGVIMRFDGSLPIPVKKANFLYLIASTQMKLGKNVNRSLPSFFLDPAANTTLTNSDTVVVPLDRSPYLRSNRDIFRIGVGVDLLKLFKGEEKPETKP